MYKNSYLELLQSTAGRNANTNYLDEDDKAKKTAAQKFVDRKIKQHPVMLFSKTHTPECKIVKEALNKFELEENDFEVIEIEKRQDVNQIENYFQVLCLTNNRSVPQLWVKGKYIGGYETILRMSGDGKLAKIFRKELLIH